MVKKFRAWAMELVLRQDFWGAVPFFFVDGDAGAAIVGTWRKPWHYKMTIIAGSIFLATTCAFMYFNLIANVVIWLLKMIGQGGIADILTSLVTSYVQGEAHWVDFLIGGIVPTVLGGGPIRVGAIIAIAHSADLVDAIVCATALLTGDFVRGMMYVCFGDFLHRRYSVLAKRMGVRKARAIVGGVVVLVWSIGLTIRFLIL